MPSSLPVTTGVLVCPDMIGLPLPPLAQEFEAANAVLVLLVGVGAVNRRALLPLFPDDGGALVNGEDLSVATLLGPAAAAVRDLKGAC